MTVITSKVIVPFADDMDTVTFVKHFNLRHADSLGGLTGLPENIDSYVEKLYRSFHRRLHEIRTDLDHESM